jgi:oligopeptide/dipeptide ABC transporter ATP-binding protein
MAALLEVENLCVRFPVRRSWLGRPRGWVRAVEDVSFTLEAGETVGLVGESGCGKSSLGRAIVRLNEPASGSIRLKGRELAGLRGAALRACRRQIQMVFQDPAGSLDPRFTVGRSLAEALDIHRLAPLPEERVRRIASLLEAVGLEASLAARYPHEFSGGQRQRIGIARALAVEPDLMVCDEPVSALDVSVQAQVVNLLQDLQRDRGLAYLFIAHDLAVVEHLSHRVLVMYLGRVVESAPARTLLGAPRHPYTQALISAVPVVDPATRRQRRVLPGETPSPLAPPPGCPFHPRCPVAESRCREERPELRERTPGHQVACHVA